MLLSFINEQKSKIIVFLSLISLNYLENEQKNIFEELFFPINYEKELAMDQTYTLLTQKLKCARYFGVEGTNIKKTEKY